MISFKCPHCGVIIRVGDEWAGRTGKCNKCGNAVKVADNVPEFPVVIEQTGKHWKAIQAAGCASSVIAISVMIVVVQFKELQPVGMAASIIVFIGLIVYAYGRIGAWWHHG